GFANDVLPLTLSGLCERWEEIRILEIINYATYNQPQVLFETMGFGKPLDHTPLLLTPGTLAFAWGGTIRLLAEGLGVELEDIRQTYEKRPATRPIRIGPHTVEPGSMATSLRTGRPARAAIAWSSRARPPCAASSSSRTSGATMPSEACCSRRRGS